MSKLEDILWKYEDNLHLPELIDEAKLDVITLFMEIADDTIMDAASYEKFKAAVFAL